MIGLHHSDPPSLWIAKLLVLLLWLVACPSFAHAEMARHQILNVNWGAAVQSHKASSGDMLSDIRKVKGYPASPPSQLRSAENADLETINLVTSTVRPNVALSGSPVLLPMDVQRLKRDIISGNALTNKEAPGSYFGFLRSSGFHPGPYGYRAYFRLKSESSVMISGSTITYDLQTNPRLPTLDSCEQLIAKAKSAGRDVTPEAANDAFYNYLSEYETRLGLADEWFSVNEAAVPCSFAGALIEVHILCDASGQIDCKVREVARDVIRALNFVGGAPRPRTNPTINDPISALAKLVSDLESDASQSRIKFPAYAPPGELLKDTSAKGKGGSLDTHSYGALTFPTDLSAVAQTVVYREDQHCLAGFDEEPTDIHCKRKKGNVVIKRVEKGHWRDNFCEERSGNTLFVCPAGEGHAGQDIWGDWTGKAGKFPIFAVTDGIAFRRFPKQPAVTVSDIQVTNIDYVYRHMRPSELSKHGIGKADPVPVKRGCPIALVDRIMKAQADGSILDDGTRYGPTAVHLHFEIRVPTRSGFQYVSPYQSLVSAHKSGLAKSKAILPSGNC